MSVQVRLHPAVGVEVEHRDVTALTPEEASGLRHAAAEHGLIVVRGQELDEESLVKVAGRFGEPETFAPPRALAHRPEVCTVGQEVPGDTTHSARYWHADGSLQPVPPTLSLFYAYQVPSRGGGTLFVSAYSAYEALPADLRERAGELHAVMTNGHRRPLVWTHRITGRPALSVDLGRTAGIEGMGRDEAAAFLAGLREAYVRPELVYEHVPRRGDLLIWDNVATVHRATKALAPDEPRLMLRTTVRGDSLV